jgi:hypothetical protein
MSSMITDTKLLLDHLGNSRCGPDLSSKAESFGTLCQPCRQLGLLLGAQSRLCSWWWLMSQGLHSLSLRFLEPLAHCTLTHPECGCDVFLSPSLFLQFPGTHPSSFPPILWRGRFLAHTSFDRPFFFVLYFFRLRSIKGENC